MWQTLVHEIETLFSGYGYIPMIALFVGLVLLSTEFFLPGFGIFGISGSIFSLLGIVTRMVIGGTVYQLLLMLSFAIIVVVIVAVVVVVLGKAGLLRTGLIQNKTAIPTSNANPNKKYLKLVGKVGFATTDFHPIGEFTYKGVKYEAKSTNEFIEKNSKVEIVEIKGDEIYVKKA